MQMNKHGLLSSHKNLKETKNLVICAMMLALCMILRYFAVDITPTMRISISYLPISVLGMLLGPVPAALVGGASDVLAYFLKPTGSFFPGYTITAALSGLVFGVGLYNAKPSLLRVAIVRGIIVLLFNIGLNTLWSAILYGDSFFVLLPGRALKNLIQYPIDVMLIWALLRFLMPQLFKAIKG